MSGGHFDYNQYRIDEIADEVRRVIKRNPDVDSPYSQKTIEELMNGVKALKVAGIYAQRIDWLLSCDDGEDSFHRRLSDELTTELEKETP